MMPNMDGHMHVYIVQIRYEIRVSNSQSLKIFYNIASDTLKLAQKLSVKIQINFIV